MATTFLEPGGDADFTIAQGNGFWKGGIIGSPTITSSIFHGAHKNSIFFPANSANGLFATAGSVIDSGTRISFYLYIQTLPSGAFGVPVVVENAAGTNGTVEIKITSAGVIQLARPDTDAQIGTNGPTLSVGIWYRISLAFTVTSTTVNRFELFVNGVSGISITNATISATGSNLLYFANANADPAFHWNISDVYVDNLSTLVDTGNIWVTAKRPVSNGTTNGFTTQIGSGGSGYGTGHAPQVNERPINTNNGWSIVGSGSVVTEEYSIEGQGVGDISTVGGTIIDYMGWVSSRTLLAETASIIVAGATLAISLTTNITTFFKFAGSTIYPAGGTDIGLQTSATVTTVSLYECGILVAFIPSPANNLSILGAG